MVADAECRTAQTQTCSAVAPAPGCQLVLRQDFNQSGLYCLNVSLANGNSLAVASTRVAVGGGRGMGWGRKGRGRCGAAAELLLPPQERPQLPVAPRSPWGCCSLLLLWARLPTPTGERGEGLGQGGGEGHGDITASPPLPSACSRVKYSPLLPAAPPAPRPHSWLPPGAALRLLLRQAFGGAPSGESSPLLRANTV